VECEQELVSGYCTDYSGFRYACFFLAEYLNMLTVSGMATTLFLGSYHAPWPLNRPSVITDGVVTGQSPGLLDVGFMVNVLDVLNSGWFGPVWFTLKVAVCIYVFIWLRGALPRFRYDQFMDLGWRWLIPISLGWIVLMAAVLVIRWGGLFDRNVLFIVMGVVVVVLLASLFLGMRSSGPPEVRSEVSRVPARPVSGAHAGYPVPPFPGEAPPELDGVLDAELVVAAGADAGGPPGAGGEEA
jgi:NADH-quinone oxidoreductase subunit H